MTADREALGRTFDRSALLYDEARPGYPDALFDDLSRLGRLTPGAEVLELGCGTGKASVALAQRGYRLTCLEPGANLAAVARRNLAPFPDAQIVETTFEEWRLEEGAFALVVAATSFEWLDPAVKYERVARALKPGGCAAVFANWQIETPDADGFWLVSEDLYRRYAPHTVVPWNTLSDLPRAIQRGFVDAGLEEVAVLTYPWVEAYDRERYIKVLQTFSGHIALSEQNRAGLLKDIAALIDTRYGGYVEKHWYTVLELAQKPQ